MKAYAYNGKYKQNEWVVVPNENCKFIHNNSLSSDNITMAVFEEDGRIYRMAYIRTHEASYMKCPLGEVKESIYKSIEEAENDVRFNDNGFRYFGMDDDYYCEWCTRDR